MKDLKPPIGIIPQLHWRYKRLVELHEAILRYEEFYKEPDQNIQKSLNVWKEEYINHETWIHDNHNEFWLEHFKTA